jgi:formylmethanofuran dehydrogenase subunit B
VAKIFRDVACTVCGCVCDDLVLHVEAGRIVAAGRACALSEPWFLGQNAEYGPPVTVDGVAASFDYAVRRAADILSQSRDPLICGLSSSGTSGMRAAVQLTETLGATLDTASSNLETASILALQSVGMSTATLGEVRNRADLVIYWGSNPLDSHPRHVERFVDAPGTFVPGGRSGRLLVVVDVERTAVAEMADQFLRVEPGGDIDLLQALRASVQGGEPSGTSTGGVAQEEVLALANQLKTCRYGAVFFGAGLTGHGNPQANVAELLQLVAELNAHTRFVAMPMRSVGTSNVLTWLTGYPMAVNFAGGYPNYDPDKYRAEVLLERGEVDAVVLVGAASAAQLSAVARQSLSQLPIIALGNPTENSPVAPAVSFTTATSGVHRAGTAYRMDDVPIPLRAVLDSPWPSDAEVLWAIDQECARVLSSSPLYDPRSGTHTDGRESRV